MSYVDVGNVVYRLVFIVLFRDLGLSLIYYAPDDPLGQRLSATFVMASIYA